MGEAGGWRVGGGTCGGGGGGVPFLGRPGQGWGSVAYSQWSNDCGMCWAQAAGGLLVGFPMGALQRHFLLWAAWVRKHIEGPSPAPSLEGSPLPLQHLPSARPDGNKAGQTTQGTEARQGTVVA